MLISETVVSNEHFVGAAPFENIRRERAPVSEGPWAGMVRLIHGLVRMMGR